MVLPAALPLMLDARESHTAHEMCSCGCGNPEGACCCTAHRASSLAMRCAGSSGPDIDSPQINPPLGPPGPIPLPLPEPSSTHPVDRLPTFTDCEPRPETPPPRA